MPVRRALTTLLVVFAASFSSSCGSDHRSAAVEAAHGKNAMATISSPAFVPGGGWHTSETSLTGYAGEGDIPVAWAANVPFSGADAGQDFPTKTINALPSGGIVIVAVGPRPYLGEIDFPHLSLPLKLTDGQVTTGSYEGKPAPGLSFFFVDTRIGDQLLNVWGYLGQDPPGATIQAEADRALATLRVPG
jgi:hypothetical protein